MTERPFSIGAHIERSVTGPTWHGDSLCQLLADVTNEEARARIAPGIHSIAELVGHIGAWATIAEGRLTRDTGITPDEVDWPAVDASSADAWRAVIADMGARHASLARAASALDAAALAATLPGKGYSAELILRGVSEHAAYHGGQIALLKKLVRQRA